MDTYKDLNVWKESVELVTLVYKVTSNFPETEKYGLTNQIRRCSVSVPSNIAEGFCRQSNGDFIRFLRISYGSSAELETQLIIAQNLGFLSEEEFTNVNERVIIIRKMINKLMSSIADN